MDNVRTATMPSHQLDFPHGPIGPNSGRVSQEKKYNRTVNVRTVRSFDLQSPGKPLTVKWYLRGEAI